MVDQGPLTPGASFALLSESGSARRGYSGGGLSTASGRLQSDGVSSSPPSDFGSARRAIAQ